MVRVTLVCSVALLLARCAADSGGSLPRQARSDPRTSVLSRAPFTETIVLTGELDAARGDIITVPKLPQWQSSVKWLAADGIEVLAGERVVELDNSSFIANLEEKKRAEDEAGQSLNQAMAEAEADLSKKALEVEKKRVAWEKAKLDAAVPEELTSRATFEDNKVKLARTAAELAKAKTVLQSSKRSHEAERLNLQLTVDRARREIAIAESANDSLILTAPRAGILVVREHPWEGRKLQTGDSVWVGLPIAGIPEPSSIQIVALMADVDDGKVTPGMAARVTLDAYPKRSFDGVVAYVAPVAQETARATLRRFYRVVIELENPDPELMRPGFSVRAEVVRQQLKSALVADRAAIDFSLPSPMLRKAGGDLVKVSLGGCNARQCVVTSGATEGTRTSSMPAAPESR